MKAALGSRISSYYSASSFDSDAQLANIESTSPSLVARATDNSIHLSITTTQNESTMIACFGTNAETVELTVVSIDDYLVNGNFSTSDAWILGPGAAYVSGTMTWDGTQSGASEIWQPITASTGKTYRVTIHIASITAGSIEHIALDGTIVATDIGSIGAYTFDIVSPSSSPDFHLQVSTDFVGTVYSISCMFLGHSGSIDLPAIPSWADWVDDINRVSDRRLFWIDFDQAMTEGAYITLMLTSATGTQCALGRLVVDRAVVLPVPLYGLNRTVKRNDVRIKLLDGSQYRRARISQEIYSGSYASRWSDNSSDVLLHEIAHNVKTSPVPWKLNDDSMPDIIIYGELSSIQKEFTTYNNDTYSFSITEEI